MKKALLLIIALSGAAVVLSGCTSVAEKAAETAIEASTNSQVDIDADNNQITINTNAGSMTAGESVDLPKDFPDDVYVVGGTIKSAMQLSDQDGFAVSILTGKTVSSVKNIYQDELKGAGWEITATLDFGAGTTISATKGDRIVTVSASEDTESGDTLVTITTSVTKP